MEIQSRFFLWYTEDIVLRLLVSGNELSIERSFPMKRNDILLIAGILLAALLATVFYHLIYNENGTMVQVTVDGTITNSFPLTADTSYTIKTTDGGINVLEIKNNTARIIEANCPDKLCVHQRTISHEGENLICLPHKVAVTITDDSKKATLDGVAQ